MSTPGIQYVINATLGDLRALDQLHRQLMNLRELADRGADFTLRVDPTALNGIKESVARAVASGVRDGGGRVRAGGGGTASDAGVGALVDEMRIAVNLLKTMAERQGQGGGRAAAAPPPQASGSTSYVDDSGNQVVNLRSRLQKVRTRVEKMDQLKERNAVEMAKVMEDFITQFSKNPAAEKQANDRLQGLLARAQFGKGNAAKLEAFESLKGWFERVQGWLKSQEEELRKQVRDAERHLDNAMTNQGYDPGTGANNPIRNRVAGRPAGAQGFAIDASAITAAFEKAAEAFAQRLMTYLPEFHGGGGAGGMPPVMGSGGSYSTPVGGNAGSALMYKMCRACNGTGRFKGGAVCWRCGGTGDENHPNMSNPELQEAIRSGRASINKVGNAQSNPVSGTMTTPIIPHSRAQEQALLYQLDKMNKQYYGANMTDDDRAVLDRRMSPLIEQLEAGGVPRSRYHASQRVVNGTYVSRSEYTKMFGGVDETGKKVLPDPAYIPQSVEHGIKYSAADPIRATQSNINALAAAMKNLEQIDLSRTETQFRELGDTIAKMTNEMQDFDKKVGRIYGGGGSGERLAYQKMMNAEKERHREAMNTLKTGAQQEVEAERVKQRAQRLYNADVLTRQAMGLGGVSEMSDELLQGRIGRGFRRLGRFTTRAEELQAQSNALYASGLPQDENARDRLQNLSNFMAARGMLFGDLQQAYTRNPKKYASLSGVGDLNQELARSAAVNMHLREYEDADQAHTAAMFAKKSPEELSQHVTRMDAAKAALAGLGISGNNIGELKANGAKLQTQVDESAKSFLKLAGAQQEQIMMSEKQSKMWDRLGVKFRDIFAYLISGTLIYGAVNAARKALTETMKFESDMAEVQGIFISKTQAQRDMVQSGVMQSAAQYGVDRSQVAGVAKLFAQTGANPEKTMALTNATLLASKGAGLDMGQASEMLIAVDNLTKGKVSPTDIIDRISRVEARHAVTAQDLSLILQRAGPMAAHLQPDQRGGEDALDMLMGMGTSLIEKTRVTGNAAGTTLKFLMARLSAPEVQRKLQDNFGIMLGERNGGEMRGMTDIFGDIAKQYNQYRQSGETGKAASLLTTFAGARQANAAAALFDDWKSTMDVARESSIAFGDSQRRLAIQMDTLSTKVGQAGSALNNMATRLIEKSGLLDLLKGGSSLVAGGANFVANHPELGIAAGYGAGALAKYGLQGLSAEGGLGAMLPMGMLKWAPYLAKGLGFLGVGGAAMTAFSLGESAIYRGVKVGGKSLDEYRRDEELYGPEKFDRSTYDKSPQGQEFAALANKYGLSSASFYSKISEASDYAMQQADKQFPGHGRDPNNPKLARFLEEEFTKRLQDGMLPGFDHVTDKAEATAEALDMLRKSILYGGVPNFAQQGGFGEKAEQLGQEFMRNMQMGPSNKLKAAMGTGLILGDGNVPTQSGDVGSFLTEAIRNRHTRRLAYSDVGMYYNTDIATRAGSTTAAARQRDIIQILNSMAPAMGVGSALSTAHLHGNDSATLVMEAERIMTAGQYAGKGIHSLGEALDALAENMGENSDTYKNLLKNIQDNIDQGLHVRERVKTANGQIQDVSLMGGGGVFAEKVMDMERKAIQNLMKGMDSDDPRYQKLQQLAKIHESPDARERHRLDIVGALNGVNMRAYLKDMVLDEFFRFAGRESEINIGSQYIPGTGAPFNVHQERAQNAAQFLQGMVGVTARLPIERMRAAHKLSLAMRARGTITGSDFVGDLTEYMPEDERQVLTKGLNDELGKIVKSGKMNDTQIRQLGITLATIKRAAKDWSSGKPDELFDTLPEEDKNLLKSLMHIDDKNLGAFGATASEAFLKFAAHLSTGANTITAADQGKLTTLSGENARSMLRVRNASAMRDLDLSRGLGLAEAHTDRVEVLNIRREMITAARESSVAMAQETQRGSLATIYEQARQSGHLDASGNLNPNSLEFQQAKEAGQQFQTAVEEAYHTAQQNMVQLLDQQHLDYVKRVEEHADELMKGITSPITNLLSDPRRLTSSHGAGEAFASIGAFANQKIAASLMDNLFGPEGMFTDIIGDKLKNSAVFQEAAIIRMAHIDGIVQGFRTVGLVSPGFGTNGLPSAGNAAPGSMFSPAGAVWAGLGGAHLISRGASPSVVNAMHELAGTDLANPQNVSDEFLGNIANANFNFNPKEGQKGAVAMQLATLGSIYASSIMFGGTKKYRDGTPKNYASEGSQFGAMAGAMLPFPGGSIVGAFMGGLLGSLFHRREHKNTPEYEALAKIERNTRESVDAITNQTRSLLSPENRLLYSPSTFSMPQMQPFGASASGAGSLQQVQMNISIPVNAGDRSAEDLAAEIAGHLKTQLSTLGTFTDSRF